MNAHDFYTMFSGARKAEFDAATTYDEFCDNVAKTNPGHAALLKKYVWAPPVFDTAKRGKYTAEPLRLPKVEKFSELFHSARLMPQPNPQSVSKPDKGWRYAGGYNGAPALSGHFGGGYSITLYPDNTVVRSHTGKVQWHCTYVDPKSIVSHYNGFEIITRDDGHLVIGTESEPNGFRFRYYVALIDRGDSFFDLYPAEDQEFYINQKMAGELAWGSIILSPTGRGEILSPDYTLPTCPIKLHNPRR